MSKPTGQSRVQSAVIVAGSMITGWVIAWMTFDFGPEPRPVDHVVDVASAAEVDEVERELAAIRRELAAQAGEPEPVREIIREVGGQAEPIVDAEAPAILERDPDTLSPDERARWQAAELARIERVFDGYDERLASEARDHDWAPQAEAQIDRVLAELREQDGLFATTNLLASECGSATCRAEFGHGDPDEQRHFMQTLATQVGGEFVQTDIRTFAEPDGGLRTEVFFTRNDDLS